MEGGEEGENVSLNKQILLGQTSQLPGPRLVMQEEEA